MPRVTTEATDILFRTWHTQPHLDRQSTTSFPETLNPTTIQFSLANCLDGINIRSCLSTIAIFIEVYIPYRNMENIINTVIMHFIYFIILRHTSNSIFHIVSRSINIISGHSYFTQPIYRHFPSPTYIPIPQLIALLISNMVTYDINCPSPRLLHNLCAPLGGTCPGSSWKRSR